MPPCFLLCQETAALVQFAYLKCFFTRTILTFFQGLYQMCRHDRILSGIVADCGRPVRMRYCSNAAYPDREEDLPQCLDMQKALTLIRNTHAQQHTGEVENCHPRVPSAHLTPCGMTSSIQGCLAMCTPRASQLQQMFCTSCCEVYWTCRCFG